MKLKEYIKQALEANKDYDVIHFDIGVDEELNVRPSSQNRIKFKVVRQWKN